MQNVFNIPTKRYTSPHKTKFHDTNILIDGVGKSSFVRALGGKQQFKTRDSDGNGDQSEPPSRSRGQRNQVSHDRSDSQNLDGFDVIDTESDRDDSELIVPPFSITIDNETIMIVDTAARDVVNVQQQMNDADLVLVVINAAKNKSIEELDDYWIDQFSETSLQTPIVAVFNKIDKLSPNQLQQLKNRFLKPTREHFVVK